MPKRYLRTWEYCISVRANWTNCEGIVDGVLDGIHQVNAKRDYTVPCEQSDVPFIRVEDFRLHWCHSHHQPLIKCELDRTKSEGAQ